MSQISQDLYPWMTQELIVDILNSSENNATALEVLDYKMHDAVGKGENYTSHLIRVSVDYKVLSDDANVKTKSFVIKTKLQPEFNEIFEKISLFKKEITFYRDILPKFHQYLEGFKFTPRCFQISENPVYLAFEDLKPNGYSNLNRRTGLDFNATQMVLKKVARYHAMGAQLYQDEPELFDVHKLQVINLDDTNMMNVYLCGLKDCQELCHQWPGYEHMTDKLEKLTKVFINKVAASYETIDTEFNVITHGDLWVNNIMFKFDETNSPIDVIMVDFQIGYYGSPAIDLAYLLLTSTTNDIGEQEWDRLIQIYHAELVTTLKSIGYTKPIPSLIEIQIQMLKRSLYAVMVSFILLVARHIEQTDHASVDLFVFENPKVKKIRQALFDLDEVKERVLYLLDYFERKGFLESE